MITIPITFGSFAGANPTNEEIYLFALRGSVCEVAVFPHIPYPSKYALCPDPSETTLSSSIFIVSEVSFDTISFCF